LPAAFAAFAAEVEEQPGVEGKVGMAAEKPCDRNPNSNPEASALAIQTSFPPFDLHPRRS